MPKQHRHRLTITALLLLYLLVPALAYAADPPWIFGMHDSGGEQHAVAKGKQIWIVFTEAVGCDPSDTSGRDYTQWSNAGHGVIVRLNNGYGTDGTLPYQAKYQDFAARCANFVKASKGCSIWIIGNETNLTREWPGNESGEPITVARYVDCYNRCYAAIKAAVPAAQVCPSPSGTWAPPLPHYGIEGFLDYWVNILNGIGASKIDALALHAYTHGCDPSLVTSDARMGPPYENIYYNFRVYKNYMAAIPSTMASKPVYITECDENTECPDPPPVPRHTWANTNSGWVRNVYSEIDSWNKNNPQKIHCVALFRWIDTAEGEWNFGISQRQGVIDDWRAAMESDYRWNTTPAVHLTGGPRVIVGTNSATVKWDTDIASSSLVAYGTTASYGKSKYDSTNLNSHSLLITGLLPDTAYHYKISSSRTGYTPLYTGDLTFRTAPANQAFTNGDFEIGQISPWSLSGTIDGIQSGTWLNGVTPHGGRYMLGAAANGGNKNASILQRISAIPGRFYRLNGWGYTWQQGGSNTANRVRFGLDPFGGADPDSLDIVWTDTLSPQGSWAVATKPVKAQAAAATVFAEVRQDPGLTWQVSCLDDITLHEMPDNAIQSVKGMPDGVEAAVYGRIATTDGPSFYIVEADRQSGIRVESSVPVSPGKTVDLIGTLGSNPQTGERQINASVVEVTGTASLPKPICIRVSSLAGADFNSFTKGASGKSGLNNVGLLVRTYGRVKSLGGGSFCIDDGSGITLKVISTASVDQGDYVAVTGVVGLEGTQTNRYPVIITRVINDVTRY